MEEKSKLIKKTRIVSKVIGTLLFGLIANWGYNTALSRQHLYFARETEKLSSFYGMTNAALGNEDSAIAKYTKEMELDREKDIKEQLKILLENKLNLDVDGKFYFCKLSSKSFAHQHAYLMKKDINNQLPNYIKLNFHELEKWLKK